MRPPATRPRTAPLAMLLLMLRLAAGCGPAPVPTGEAAVPDEPAARRALAAALDDWKAGKPAGSVAGAVPAIHVIDSHRPPGRIPGRCDILGEVAGDARRCYAVRVTFPGDDPPRVERFVVLGKAPMFVFRHEDFLMMSRWEHPMPDDDTVKAAEADPRAHHAP